MQELCYQTLV